MPIYEFYCTPCHTIYKFFSLRVDTEKIPKCPRCGYENLKRRPSVFTALTGRKEEIDDETGMPPINESKMEKAMSMLSKEAENISEDDPKQAAQLMRKLSEATGLKMGAGMEEALARLEKGEDPEKIEEELGDLLEEEDPFQMESKGKKSGPTSKPHKDDTLYDM